MPSALTVPCVVCSRRAAASSWVSVSRAANCLGRSRGTLCISFVVQMPCRSGSPHVVRGAFHVDVVGLPCPASGLGTRRSYNLRFREVGPYSEEKSMVTSVRRVIVFAALMVFAAVSAWPQASVTGSIAGAVRDTTGAVLPGVTVEVASPALIEKVRVAITDDQGQYKILDLRPGVYSVSFALPGFATVKREGIELT